MSAPAANSFSPPYRTTARTVGSAAISAAACVKPSCTLALSAFIGGLSSLIVATDCCASTCTSSPTMHLLCRATILRSKTSGTKGTLPGQRERPDVLDAELRNGEPAPGSSLGRVPGRSFPRRARQRNALPAIQESAHFALAVTAVATWRADRGKLSATGPASNGLRVHPKHGGDFGR